MGGFSQAVFMHASDSKIFNGKSRREQPAR